MTIYAVPPRNGATIHLHDPDFRPMSKRFRSIASHAGLCSALVIYSENEPDIKPLTEATGWAGAHRRDDGLPAQEWRWCALCLGRAIAAFGIDQDCIELIVKAQDNATSTQDRGRESPGDGAVDRGGERP